MFTVFDCIKPEQVSRTVLVSSKPDVELLFILHDGSSALLVLVGLIPTKADDLLELIQRAVGFVILQFFDRLELPDSDSYAERDAARRDARFVVFCV